MKKHIPNIITLLNLTSGVLAVLFATQNQLEYAAYFVFLGITFDFFDGFIARILNVKSKFGLQLDSLADMVTSGVAPGIVIFQLLRNTITTADTATYLSQIKDVNYLPFIGLLIILAAAYRLANFNIDDRQTVDFIGLPTPALSIFIVSLPLVIKYSDVDWALNFFSNSYFLIATSLIGSYLMNSQIKMFSLKFSNYSFKANKLKYFFLISTLALIIALKIVSIPLIIILYILMSILNNLWLKTNRASI